MKENRFVEIRGVFIALSNIADKRVEGFDQIVESQQLHGMFKQYEKCGFGRVIIECQGREYRSIHEFRCKSPREAEELLGQFHIDESRGGFEIEIKMPASANFDTNLRGPSPLEALLGAMNATMATIGIRNQPWLPHSDSATTRDAEILAHVDELAKQEEAQAKKKPWEFLGPPL